MGHPLGFRMSSIEIDDAGSRRFSSYMSFCKILHGVTWPRYSIGIADLYEKVWFSNRILSKVAGSR